MKIPKTVSVMGLIYKVKQVSKKEIDKVFEGAAGVCVPEFSTIYLLKTLNPNVKKRVLCHEIGHAFLERIGADQMLNANENEIMAQSIGMLLCDFSTT